jgi:hypothetical protein
LHATSKLSGCFYHHGLEAEVVVVGVFVGVEGVEGGDKVCLEADQAPSSWDAGGGALTRMLHVCF